MATAQLDTVLRHLHHLAGSAGRPTDRQLLEAFATLGDEAAFAELVGRHGPMVLRVCRRVLGHEQDAEDAFQATFLTLARNARAVRKGGSLAAFLHGVALRTALKARRSAARRRNHESRRMAAAQMTAPAPAWDEVQAALDEEIQRLPDIFRTTFVLCILQGKSGPEAAAELGCKEGTVSSRLTRARKVLQQRLSRRGIQLGAVLGALSGVAVSPALARAAVRAGLAAGKQNGGVIPPSVASLAVRCPGTLVSAKARLAAVLVLAVGLCAAALTRQALATRAGEPPAERPEAAPAPKAPRDDKEAAAFRGRVLDPAGKPFAGAKIYLFYPTPRKVAMPVRVVSDAEGRFQFTVGRAEFDRTGSRAPWNEAAPMAVVDGFGLGIPRGGAGRAADREVTLQLPADDVPIDGRVLDLQGKPIAGVRVRVRGVREPLRGDLGVFLDALVTQKEGYNVQGGLLAGLHHPYMPLDFDGIFAPVVTDAAGKFRIRGIGRERVADLLFEAPAIESKYVYALTRPAARVEVPNHRRARGVVVMTHYGCSFDHVAAPSQPVVGVVRDKDTGAPLAGAVVSANVLPGGFVDQRLAFEAVTDRSGRYRITGLPRGPDGSLQATAPSDLPYLNSLQKIVETPGLEPATVNFALKRGVWIDVRVTDKATGKPVPGSVEYNVFADNPHLKGAPGFTTPMHQETYAEEGRFRLVGLPGRGLIAAWAADNRYRLGAGAEKVKEFNNGFLQLTPSYVSARHTHGVALVNPAVGAESVSVEIALDPGRTLAGTVLGPDGKPLAGALASGLDEYTRWTDEPLRTAAFTVTGLGPRQQRLLQFAHLEKGLAGSLLVHGDAQGPLIVRLVHAGTLTGRLVTRQGKPAVGGEIHALNREFIAPDGIIPVPKDVGSLPRPVRTDKDGKFRLEGLAPGLKYRLSYLTYAYYLRILGPGMDNLTVKPGQTKDLGRVEVEVEVKPPQQ
jgi:RNA polymerase sigma factor (sigma-70 family)